jgi:hypothetical protein
MKRLGTIAIVIAGLALFGFVVFQIGVASQHQRQHQREPQRSEAPNHQKGDTDNSSVTKSGIQIECDPNCAAQESKDHANESTIARFFRKAVDDPLTAFTGILALTTLFLAVYTAIVARATKAAAEHIPRVERAYLFIGPANIILHSKPDRTLFCLVADNAGKTPAIITEICLTYPATQPVENPRISISLKSGRSKW